MQEKRMVRVRIALMVNERGEWHAIGYHKWTDAEAMAMVLEGFDTEESPFEAKYFVEVDVPVPEVVVLEGRLGEAT